MLTIFIELPEAVSASYFSYLTVVYLLEWLICVNIKSNMFLGLFWDIPHYLNIT